MKAAHTRENQRGFAHLALFGVLFLAIVGVLGFVGYNAWQKQSANAGGSSTVGSNVCGGGYTLKKSLSFNGQYGYVAVYTKGAKANTDWCALTLRDSSAKGVSGMTLVWLQKADSKGYTQGAQAKDEDKYKQYAGPVYIKDSAFVKVGGYVKYAGKQYTFPGPAHTLSN